MNEAAVAAGDLDEWLVHVYYYNFVVFYSLVGVSHSVFERTPLFRVQGCASTYVFPAMRPAEL